MPIVHKTKAGGPGPPAAQVLPRSISLPAQGLPAALHQNGCDAQTNGGPACERKERDPHGFPRSVVDFASIAYRARRQRRNGPSVPGTLIFNLGKIAPFRGRNILPKRVAASLPWALIPDIDRKHRWQARLLTSHGRCATIPAAALTCSRPPVSWVAPPGLVVRVHHRSPDLKPGARAAPATRR
jgi:hypothetical protein